MKENETKRPIKGSHYGMVYMGTQSPTQGKEYRCPICWETMFWGEAKRHEHRSADDDSDTFDY